ncbi:unnamed protein product, partial [Brachionus calyciflorus]
MTEDDKKVVDRIFEHLKDKCKVSTVSLYNEFNSRRPRLNETYSQFAGSLQELLNKACPGLGTNEKKMLLRSKLCDHLPEHMKALVRFNKDKPWDELITCLEENSVRNSSFETYGKIEVKDEPVDLNHVRAFSKRFDGECYNCGIKGHKKINCYKLKRAKESANRGGFNKRNGRVSGGERSHEKRRSVRFKRDDESAEVSTMDAETYESDDSRAEVNTVEAVTRLAEEVPVDTAVELDVCSVNVGVTLIKKHVEIGIKNIGEKVRLNALIDGGASHSFIQLDKLDSRTQKLINDFKNGSGQNASGLFKINLTIRGATNTISELCVIAPMEIKIGGWIGTHNFVISESLQGKEAIIGRDFLKVNKVVIDHGEDKMKIKTCSTEKFHGDCTLLYEYSLIPRCQRTVCLKVETDTLAKEVVFTPTYG